MPIAATEREGGHSQGGIIPEKWSGDEGWLGGGYGRLSMHCLSFARSSKSQSQLGLIDDVRYTELAT